MAQSPFDKKTAFITGAGGGLGRALAEHFLSIGANVVVCDINNELVQDFKDKVSSANPDRTLVLKADITDDKALDDIFSQAEKTFGHLDFVINSAGVVRPHPIRIYTKTSLQDVRGR